MLFSQLWAAYAAEKSVCPFNRKVSALLFVVGRLCAEEFVCLFTEKSVRFSLLLAASAAEKSVCPFTQT